MSTQPTTLAELQKMYSAYTPTQKTPKPYVLWALADFHRFLSEHLVVIYSHSDTQYQEILRHIESLSPTEERLLFQSYFDKPGGKLQRLLLNQPTLHPIPTVCSRAHPILRAAMLQIGLGRTEIITFAQRFSEKFLRNTVERASIHRNTKRAESVGQIMQDKFRTTLKQVLEESYGPGCSLPKYWFVVEYEVPSNQEGRGAACGFHLHGQIAAGKEMFPEIKRALYKVAECYKNPSGKMRSGGYRQRYDNLAVHFGLPSEKHCQLWKVKTSGQLEGKGRRRVRCLSTIPLNGWVSPDQYDFNSAKYAGEDTAFTSFMAKERLGVRLGASVFYQSPGVNSEAQACLGLFRRLLGHLQAT